MNRLVNSVSGLVRLFSQVSLQNGRATIPTTCTKSYISGLGQGWECYPFRGMATLTQMHRKGPPKKKLKRPGPTEGNPFMKAVVLKTIIKKPRKPNSANRKCVRIKLSNGQEATAYIPGEGHNLQEHNIVLVRGGRSQDLSGVKLKCIRGKYDLAHVKKEP